MLFQELLAASRLQAKPGESHSGFHHQCKYSVSALSSRSNSIQKLGSSAGHVLHSLFSYARNTNGNITALSILLHQFHLLRWAVAYLITLYQSRNERLYSSYNSVSPNYAPQTDQQATKNGRTSPKRWAACCKDRANTPHRSTLHGVCLSCSRARGWRRHESLPGPLREECETHVLRCLAVSGYFKTSIGIRFRDDVGNQ